MQAELHFGKAETRAHIGHTVIAGQSHLQPATKTCAMNDGHRRTGQRLKPLEGLMSLIDQRFQLFGAGA